MTTDPLQSTISSDPAMVHMQARIDRWQAENDHRAVFLRCYRMMTGNMLAAIQRDEFHDSAWVDRLLHRFAEYYFIALEAYEAGEAVPAVWQQAYEAARKPHTLAIQNLLLGVNAHINFDLALALVDILESEWASLTDSQRHSRYEDHCEVNRVIGKTIDAVQDEVIEPAMPVMDLIDKLMGPVDEYVISRLLAHWREKVWGHAIELLEVPDTAARANQIEQYEKEVLQLGEIIII